MDKKNSEKTADHSTESVFGRVTDCLNLNVRAEPDPNAAINCTILKETRVIVDTNESTKSWLKICTEAGIEGFCMKRYIAIEK